MTPLKRLSLAPLLIFKTLCSMILSLPFHGWWPMVFWTSVSQSLKFNWPVGSFTINLVSLPTFQVNASPSTAPIMTPFRALEITNPSKSFAIGSPLSLLWSRPMRAVSRNFGITKTPMCESIRSPRPPVSRF